MTAAGSSVMLRSREPAVFGYCFTGAGSSVMLRSREPPVNIGLSDLTAAGSSVDASLSGTGSLWIIRGPKKAIRVCGLGFYLVYNIRIL